MAKMHHFEIRHYRTFPKFQEGHIGLSPFKYDIFSNIIYLKSEQVPQEVSAESQILALLSCLSF